MHLIEFIYSESKKKKQGINNTQVMKFVACSCSELLIIANSVDPFLVDNKNLSKGETQQI